MSDNNQQTLTLRDTGGDLTQFNPQQTDARLRQARFLTEEAAALRDWETLQTAAAFQVEEQIRFVQWWTHAISVRESAGSNQWSSQDHGTTMEQAEQETRISNQRVARWRKSLGMTPESTVPDPIKQQDYFDAIIHEARKAAGWDDNHLAFNAGNDEWCTPQHWIDLARDAMGGIDLDPATNAGAQTRIQADRYFTIEADSLSERWDANALWLNPPYSKNRIVLFVQKLLDEIAAGHVTQAIVLVNAATSSEWFQRLFRHASLACLPTDRIRFLKPDGAPADGHPPIGQAFFYFGEGWQRFAAMFVEEGVLAQVVDRSPA